MLKWDGSILFTKGGGDILKKINCCPGYVVERGEIIIRRNNYQIVEKFS